MDDDIGVCLPVHESVALGDSVSVNGTCLTVTELSASGFAFGLAPETLRRTNLGALKEGSGVNLERSLAANGRLGGHIVQGHVDSTGVKADEANNNLNPLTDSLPLPTVADEFFPSLGCCERRRCRKFERWRGKRTRCGSRSGAIRL